MDKEYDQQAFEEFMKSLFQQMNSEQEYVVFSNLENIVSMDEMELMVQNMPKYTNIEDLLESIKKM